MNTLQSFLTEFAIFKAKDQENGDADLGNNDINFDVISQGEEDPTTLDPTTDLDVSDDELDTDNGECQCKCPCCDHGKGESDEGSVDDNISVIEPEEFNIEDGDADETDEGDPTKDYNLF